MPVKQAAAMCAATARASHDLCLAVSITLSCHPSVTVFFLALHCGKTAMPGAGHQLGPTAAAAANACHDVFYEVSIRFHTTKQFCQI